MPSIGSTTQRTPLLPSRARALLPQDAVARAGPRAAGSTISPSLALSTAVTTSTELDFTSTWSAGRDRPRPPAGRLPSGVDGEGEQGRGIGAAEVTRRRRRSSRRRPARTVRGGLTTLSACRASEWTSVAAASRDAWSTSRRASSSASASGSRHHSPRTRMRSTRVVADIVARFGWTERIGVTFPGVMRHGVALHRGQRGQELDRHRRRRRASTKLIPGSVRR